MAVAVKDSTETASRRPLDPLTLGSLLGAAYVLGVVAVVFYAVPSLWAAYLSVWMDKFFGSFFNLGLMMVAQFVAAVGLIFVGVRLFPDNAPKGLRAGIFAVAAGLLLIAAVTWIVGMILEANWLAGPSNRTMGMVITGAVGIGLIVGGFYLMIQPYGIKYIVQFEEQGWFSRAVFKRNQGLKVRRGTIVGILAIAAWGIVTLLNPLETQWLLTMGENFAPVLPFSGGVAVPVLTQVRFTLPIILALASLWFAFRVVNFPAFADFLIATEAEMNKVSWTTRKRLVQDTIVVLTTVIIMTLFLFVVDVSWGWLLSQKWVGVLRVNEGQVQKQLGDKEQPW